MTRLLALLAAFAVTAAVAGCGEKRETTTGAASSTSGSSAPAVTVSETEFKLTPSTARSATSGPVTVQVKNAGSTQHALEIEGPGGQLKSKTLAPGASQTLTATLKPGTYEMYCPIDGHKGKGMLGKFVVGASSGGSGSGGSGSGSGGGYSRGGTY